MKAPQKSLKDWGDQKWKTKSGKPSSETGEGTAKGKQFVAQPKSVAKKTSKYR